jgi:pyruvate-formate lyase-activating enzyme
MVNSLERFATHDGPGIRTAVYMKGCPLKCVWCSSPHTQNGVLEILFNESPCHGLGKCDAVCPEDALHYSQLGIPYTLKKLESPDDDHMQELNALVRSEGVTAEIVA